MNLNTINIAIVDDHKLFRHAIINYLTAYHGHYKINVSFEGDNGKNIIQKLHHFPADVLIMDLFMEGMNGIDSIRQLRSDIPGQKILMLSMCTDLATISELIEEGIQGYISKADEIEMVPQAIISIYKDKIFESKIMTDAMYFRRFDKSKSTKSKLVLFSDREIKIARLLWNEKTNKQIANELYLGIRSIEKIIQEMKTKVNAESLVGLLKYCIQYKIIG